MSKVLRPARKRAGYTHEGRLCGLPEPAQAGLVPISPPVYGPGVGVRRICTGHGRAPRGLDGTYALGV